MSPDNAFSPHAPLLRVRRDSAARLLHKIVDQTLEHPGLDLEWVAPITAELVQSRIDEKANLVASYTETHIEVWLVIGVRGDTPSQFLEFNTGALEVSLRSPFSRTYFVDAFLGRAMRLRTLL